jgi:hypothetical protein
LEEIGVITPQSEGEESMHTPIVVLTSGPMKDAWLAAVLLASIILMISLLFLVF